MPLLRRLLRILGIVVLAPVVFLLGCQSRLIYFPKPYGGRDMAALREAGGRVLEFRASQGKQAAFFIPPGGGGEPERIWLCFAGNGSLALDWLFFPGIRDERSALLLIDYPGYGLCEGRPSPAAIRENSTAAVRRLADELGMTLDDLKPRLAVLGHSIGCAAALMAADDLGLKRAVLISPFTTMTEMARRIVGWPLCLLNRHTFDNRRHLKSVAAKGARITIFHGGSDDVIPPAMSRELAGLAPGSVQRTEVPGAGHNDIVAMKEKEIATAMRE